MSKNKKQVMFICSVGGHLTQMLQLKDLFNEYEYILITEKTPITIPMSKKYNMKYMVYCSRKYKFTYYFKEFVNLIRALHYLIKYNPDVIVTTGTHTAVPTCVIAKWVKKKIIYIESFAKNTTPTKSAEYIQKKKIADTLVVQWETMKGVLEDAENWGWIY